MKDNNGKKVDRESVALLYLYAFMTLIMVGLVGCALVAGLVALWGTGLINVAKLTLITWVIYRVLKLMVHFAIKMDWLP